MACEDTPSTPPTDPVDTTPHIGITSVEPTAAFIGEEFTITGWGFGLDGVITHAGAELAVSEWTDDVIRAVARDWREGQLVITVRDSVRVRSFPVRSVGVAHDVVPREVEISGELMITGLGFGDGPGQVLLAGVALPIMSWADDLVRVTALGLHDHEQVIIDTRDYGTVGTPTVTTVAPSDLDMTGYRHAWAVLKASFVDYPDYATVTTDSPWKPDLEWGGLTFGGVASEYRISGQRSLTVNGSIEPSLTRMQGSFRLHESWEGSGDFHVREEDVRARNIPLFRVDADTVEYRLRGGAVLDLASAHFRESWPGQHAEAEVMVRNFSHPDPVVSIFFTRN
jgi:hypothetical protein